MPGEHAPFSPSASGRWMVCTASHLATLDTVQESSIYAHEGSICHDVAARCLKENLNAEAFRGQVIEEVTITDELAEAIQLYVDEIRGKATELGTKGGKIEHKVIVSEECWGTADAVLWNSDTLYVGDAKFGTGVLVQAERNTQLMIYGVGMLMELQTNYKLAPEKVVLSIIQPRVPDPVRVWETTRTELIEFYKTQLTPAMKSCNEGGEYVPTESTCRWCPISPCAAALKYAARGAENAFAALGSDGDSESMPAVQIPDDPVPSIETLAGVYNLRKFIDNVFKAIEGRLFHALEQGDNVPGWKLVRGRSVRKWGDEAIAEKFLIANGIEPYKQIMKTAPAIEKEVGKKKASEINLDDYIIKPEGSLTMAPESDPREAVTAVVEIEAKMSEFAPGEEEQEFELKETATSGNQEVKTRTGGALDALMGVIGGSGKPDTELKNDSTIELEDDSVTDKIESAFDIDEDAESTKTHDPEPVVTEQKPPAKVVTPPGKGTKRLALVEIGSGSIEVVAGQIGSTPNMIEKMIRWANERDGYGYRLYSNGTFEIYS